MRVSIVVAAAAVGLVGCDNSILSNVTTPFGGGGISGINIAVGDTMGATAPSFNPSVDTIPSTDTITWVVDSATSHAPFNITWDQGPTGAKLPQNSADLQAGQTYAAFLTQPGWYSYHCTHHADMLGSLLVLTAIGDRVPVRVEKHFAALPQPRGRRTTPPEVRKRADATG